MKYFVETFRALGVARGHSSYKLTKSVSFYSSVRKSSGQVKTFEVEGTMGSVPGFQFGQFC